MDLVAIMKSYSFLTVKIALTITNGTYKQIQTYRNVMDLCQVEMMLWGVIV